MKKFIPVIILIILFAGCYWLSQKVGNQNFDCSHITEKINQENRTLMLENKRISGLIKQYQIQKDSLIQLARQERQKVTDLMRIQHEKAQAIDHFTNDELLNFFAELKADSSENRK